MTKIDFLLRTDPANPIRRATHLLDAFPDHDPAATVWTNWKPAGRRPAAAGANDLLWLSIAALAADFVALRSESADGWTRQIGIKMRVTRDEWAAVNDVAARMLGFLTGEVPRLHPPPTPRAQRARRRCGRRLSPLGRSRLTGWGDQSARRGRGPIRAPCRRGGLEHQRRPSDGTS